MPSQILSITASLASTNPSKLAPITHNIHHAYPIGDRFTMGGAVAAIEQGRTYAEAQNFARSITQETSNYMTPELVVKAASLVKTGKTYALGVLLEQVLLQTRMPLVVLDPNGQVIADNDDIVAGNVTDSAIRAASPGSPQMIGWTILG